MWEPVLYCEECEAFVDCLTIGKDFPTLPELVDRLSFPVFHSESHHVFHVPFCVFHSLITPNDHIYVSRWYNNVIHNPYLFIVVCGYNVKQQQVLK